MYNLWRCYCILSSEEVSVEVSDAMNDDLKTVCRLKQVMMCWRGIRSNSLQAEVPSK